MKITLRGYYAILALASLARNPSPESRTRVEDIAGQHPIPDAFLLQIFQTLQTGAIFIGTGAVIDVASFEVTGTTGESALGFNPIFVNGDGSIPRLPEFIAFVTPDLSGVSPKQTVSVDVGSKRDEGRFVTLIALNLFLGVVDSESVQLTPQMQTLTVSSATPEIVLVAVFGEPELKVVVVDNLTYN